MKLLKEFDEGIVASMQAQAELLKAAGKSGDPEAVALTWDAMADIAIEHAKYTRNEITDQQHDHQVKTILRELKEKIIVLARANGYATE